MPNVTLEIGWKILERPELGLSTTIPILSNHYLEYQNWTWVDEYQQYTWRTFSELEAISKLGAEDVATDMSLEEGGEGHSKFMQWKGRPRMVFSTREEPDRTDSVKRDTLKTATSVGCQTAFDTRDVKCRPKAVRSVGHQIDLQSPDGTRSAVSGSGKTGPRERRVVERQGGTTNWIGEQPGPSGGMVTVVEGLLGKIEERLSKGLTCRPQVYMAEDEYLSSCREPLYEEDSHPDLKRPEDVADLCWKQIRLTKDRTKVRKWFLKFLMMAAWVVHEEHNGLDGGRTDEKMGKYRPRKDSQWFRIQRRAFRMVLTSFVRIYCSRPHGAPKKASYMLCVLAESGCWSELTKVAQSAVTTDEFVDRFSNLAPQLAVTLDCSYPTLDPWKILEMRLGGTYHSVLWEPGVLTAQDSAAKETLIKNFQVCKKNLHDEEELADPRNERGSYTAKQESSSSSSDPLAAERILPGVLANNGGRLCEIPSESSCSENWLRSWEDRSIAITFGSKRKPQHVPNLLERCPHLRSNATDESCPRNITDRRKVLLYFVDTVLPTLFPVLEFHWPGLTRRETTAALDSNPFYRQVCISTGLRHLGPYEELVVCARAAARRLLQTQMQDRSPQSKLRMLEGVLATLWYRGLFTAPLSQDLPWDKHFHIVLNLTKQLQVDFRRPTPLHRPPLLGDLYIAQIIMIDIVGGFVKGRAPYLARLYQDNLQKGQNMHLRQIMGCDDRVMFLISEAVCLEISGELEAKEIERALDDTLAGLQPFVPPACIATINAKQVSQLITLAYGATIRIYLQMAMDESATIALDLQNKLARSLMFIPTGPQGFDRAILWPLLIGGYASASGSFLRETIQARFGTFDDAHVLGNLRKIIGKVWEVTDKNEKLQLNDLRVFASIYDFLPI